MLSVILPTYNEKENINQIINKVLDVIKQNKLKAEVIVVDDNSPDQTANFIRGKHRINLIVRKDKKGLSSAIVDGINASKGDIAVVMDSDFSHPVEKIVELYKECKNNDIAIGSRYVDGGGINGWPWHRKLISKTATIMARKMLKVRERDPMSGFFAVKKEFFNKVKDKLRPKGYKVLLELIARGKPSTIEVPYVFQNRKKGRSKLNFKIITEYLKMIEELL